MTVSSPPKKPPITASTFLITGGDADGLSLDALLKVFVSCKHHVGNRNPAMLAYVDISGFRAQIVHDRIDVPVLDR